MHFPLPEFSFRTEQTGSFTATGSGSMVGNPPTNSLGWVQGTALLIYVGLSLVICCLW
jgi:hypothetical protein